MSHIVIRVYSIECDGDGCREVAGDFVVPHREANPLRAARKSISSDGWTTRDGKDFCPAHSVAAVGEDV